MPDAFGNTRHKNLQADSWWAVQHEMLQDSQAVLVFATVQNPAAPGTFDHYHCRLTGRARL